MTQCPVGSIRRKENLEIIIEDWCIGCGKCAELCPYGNINMHSFQVTKDMPVIEKKPPAAAKPAGAAGATPAAKPAAAPAPGPSPAKPPAAAGAPAPPAAPVAASTSAPAGQALAVDPTGARDKPVPVKSTLGPTEKSSAPVEVPLPAAKSAPAAAAPAPPGAAATKAPPSAPAAK